MSLAGKVVSEFVINAPAEKFYKFFRRECSNIPNITPKLIQHVEIHDGNWENHGHGSIITWYYTVDGKAEVFKEKVEFDDEKLTVIMVAIEGDVLNRYKNYKVTFQVVPKDYNHCLAILTIEYEKLDDGSPCPYKYMDIITDLTKGIASYLSI